MGRYRPPAARKSAYITPEGEARMRAELGNGRSFSQALEDWPPSTRGSWMGSDMLVLRNW